MQNADESRNEAPLPPLLYYYQSYLGCRTPCDGQKALSGINEDQASTTRVGMESGDFDKLTSIGFLERISTERDGKGFTALKLKPRFAFPYKFSLEEETRAKLTLEVENSHQLSLKHKSEWKAERLQKLKRVLSLFLLYLNKFGKDHLLKHCVLDTESCSVKFLSREVADEFMDFMSSPKLRSKRANIRGR